MIEVGVRTQVELETEDIVVIEGLNNEPIHAFEF
jgi:hypothetical protein